MVADFSVGLRMWRSLPHGRFPGKRSKRRGPKDGRFDITTESTEPTEGPIARTARSGAGPKRSGETANAARDGSRGGVPGR